MLPFNDCIVPNTINGCTSYAGEADMSEEERRGGDKAKFVSRTVKNNVPFEKNPMISDARGVRLLRAGKKGMA